MIEHSRQHTYVKCGKLVARVAKEKSLELAPLGFP